jgi:hypothetical protein
MLKMMKWKRCVLELGKTLEFIRYLERMLAKKCEGQLLLLLKGSEAPSNLKMQLLNLRVLHGKTEL